MNHGTEKNPLKENNEDELLAWPNDLDDLFYSRDDNLLNGSLAHQPLDGLSFLQNTGDSFLHLDEETQVQAEVVVSEFDLLVKPIHSSFYFFSNNLLYVSNMPRSTKEVIKDILNSCSINLLMKESAKKTVIADSVHHEDVSGAPSMSNYQVNYFDILLCYFYKNPAYFHDEIHLLFKKIRDEMIELPASLLVERIGVFTNVTRLKILVKLTAYHACLLPVLDKYSLILKPEDFKRLEFYESSKVNFSNKKEIMFAKLRLQCLNAGNDLPMKDMYQAKQPGDVNIADKYYNNQCENIYFKQLKSDICFEPFFKFILESGFSESMSRFFEQFNDHFTCEHMNAMSSIVPLEDILSSSLRLAFTRNKGIMSKMDEFFDGRWHLIQSLDLETRKDMTETSLELLKKVVSKTNRLRKLKICAPGSQYSYEQFNEVLQIGNITHLTIRNDASIKSIKLVISALKGTEVRVLDLGAKGHFKKVQGELAKHLEHTKITSYQLPKSKEIVPVLAAALKKNIDSNLLAPYLISNLRFHPRRSDLLDSSLSLEVDLNDRDKLRYAGGILANLTPDPCRFILGYFESMKHPSNRDMAQKFKAIREQTHPKDISLSLTHAGKEIWELRDELKRVKNEKEQLLEQNARLKELSEPQHNGERKLPKIMIRLSRK